MANFLDDGNTQVLSLLLQKRGVSKSDVLSKLRGWMNTYLTWRSIPERMIVSQTLLVSLNNEFVVYFINRLSKEKSPITEDTGRYINQPRTARESTFTDPWRVGHSRLETQTDSRNFRTKNRNIPVLFQTSKISSNGLADHIRYIQSFSNPTDIGYTESIAPRMTATVNKNAQEIPQTRIKTARVDPNSTYGRSGMMARAHLHHRHHDTRADSELFFDPEYETPLKRSYASIRGYKLN